MTPARKLPVGEGQPLVAVGDIDQQEQLFESLSDPEAVATVGLVERYMVPPFSVLDRRQGYWKDRTRQWTGLGIQSELGRQASGGAFKSIGSIVNSGEYSGLNTLTDGMSIFDPVVCETTYHWFCPTDGIVLDPFAGGSVRGIVAGLRGYQYVGVDLSGTQVAANREQADRIFDPERTRPRPGWRPKQPIWVQGDSRAVMREAEDLDVIPDLIFSCPPYGDLEVYSEDPADLSNMADSEFDAAYLDIIAGAVALLKPDRFAAFVVGNYRDKRGNLRDLVGLTIRAFEAAGAPLYNEAVIFDPIGTAAVRGRKQFAAKRKLVKTHQNLLVFCKGDHAAAAAAVKGPHDEEVLMASDDEKEDA